MKNEHENNVGDQRSEFSRHSSLPNSSSPTRRHEPTSAQNGPPCVFINLTETESNIEDEVTFVSSQPFIPVIDISTPPPANIIPKTSNGVKRHSGRALNFELNVSVVESADTSHKVLNCSICLNSFEKPHSTFCGHIFCQVCITNAVKTSKKCPYCCKKLDMRRIHPIYF